MFSLMFPPAILHQGREIHSFVFLHKSIQIQRNTLRDVCSAVLYKKTRGTHRDLQLSEWMRWSPQDSPYTLVGKNSLQRQIVTCQRTLLLEPRLEIMFIDQICLLTWYSRTIADTGAKSWIGNKWAVSQWQRRCWNIFLTYYIKSRKPLIFSCIIDTNKGNRVLTRPFLMDIFLLGICTQ